MQISGYNNNLNIQVVGLDCKGRRGTRITICLLESKSVTILLKFLCHFLIWIQCQVQSAQFASRHFHVRVDDNLSDHPKPDLVLLYPTNDFKSLQGIMNDLKILSVKSTFQADTCSTE